MAVSAQFVSEGQILELGAVTVDHVVTERNVSLLFCQEQLSP
jgi:hypothetical protein